MPPAVEVTATLDREIRVRGMFPVPRRRIWDGHTRPELMTRWLFDARGLAAA